MSDMRHGQSGERTLEELLTDAIEIEKLLAAPEPGQHARQVSAIATLIAQGTSDAGIVRLATALRVKADHMARKGRAAKPANGELIKDAAFRLRITLLAQKRGGSPVE